MFYLDQNVTYYVIVHRYVSTANVVKDENRLFPAALIKKLAPFNAMLGLRCKSILMSK
jgi:hypothetical protein